MPATHQRDRLPRYVEPKPVRERPVLRRHKCRYIQGHSEHDRYAADHATHDQHAYEQQQDGGQYHVAGENYQPDDRYRVALPGHYEGDSYYADSAIEANTARKTLVTYWMDWAMGRPAASC